MGDNYRGTTVILLIVNINTMQICFPNINRQREPFGFVATLTI
jgi:hypothetical protein